MLSSACEEDPTQPKDQAQAPIDSPEAVVSALSYSYQTMDLGLFKSILAHDVGPNDGYHFVSSEPAVPGETEWGYDEEARIHRRMFRPQDHVASETPVPDELYLSYITINLTRLEEFTERTDLYSADHGMDGKLDPAIWRIVDAHYGTDVFFDTQSDQDFQVIGEANFVVIEDLKKKVGSSGKFQLYMWEELVPRKQSSKPSAEGSEVHTWSNVKRLYREPIDSPEAVVRALSRSYEHMDPGLFNSILAHDVGSNARYLFYLSEPTDRGETQWGYDEEVRIQRRMFRPQVHVTGEPPVPLERWLSSITIHLTRLEEFAERSDLYSANHDMDGKLDPDLWKAVDARYGTDVFFDTQSDVDFQVTGEANFVVIEDKAKPAGRSGKFLLYIWEDFGWQVKTPGSRTEVEPPAWGAIKAMYR
jgi:predicted transcriptional regulator